MAITEINQTWADESASEETNGRVEVTVGYQILSDSPITSTLAIFADNRFPAYGSIHPDSADLLVVRRRIRRIANSRQVAEAEVVYSTQFESASTKDPNNNNSNQDPEFDFPVIEWIPIEATRVAAVGRLRDNTTGAFSANFTQITNSAGQPYYDPPVEIRASQWQVLYRRNELSVNDDVLEYLDVVNSDDFTIGGVDIPSGKALMAGARVGGREYRAGKFYYPVTYDLRLRLGYSRTGQGIAFKGWEEELQDRGYHVLNDSGELVRAVDDESNDMVEPVFLDGNGKQAANPQASLPRVYKVYFEKPFAIFNFA